jgi:light-regulated signal transduction histidine kinase (bacteriophytochrome)
MVLRGSRQRLGVDPQHAEWVFVIFQRVHYREAPYVRIGVVQVFSTKILTRGNRTMTSVGEDAGVTRRTATHMALGV